jgi:hypothetical protein
MRSRHKIPDLLKIFADGSRLSPAVGKKNGRSDKKNK